MTKLGASSPNAVKSSSAYFSYDKTTAFAFLYLGYLSVVFHMHYIQAYVVDEESWANDSAPR